MTVKELQKESEKYLDKKIKIVVGLETIDLKKNLVLLIFLMEPVLNIYKWFIQMN